MKVLWNEDWEFTLKDAPDGQWKNVTLPHDWLIYDTTDLYRDGYGIYRKSFDVELERIKASGSHVFLVFDGVYMDSEYFLNGEKIGEWKYGYSQYVLELTGHLKDGENELKVGVNFKAPNSRWYSGAGIYRDVWFMEVAESYIPENGVYIHVQRSKTDDNTPVSGTADGSIDKAPGYDLYIDTQVCGEPNIRHVLRDMSGGFVRMDQTSHRILSAEEYIHYISEETAMGHRDLVINDSLGIGADFHVIDVYHVDSPHEWSGQDPYLYTLTTSIQPKNICDCTEPVDTSEQGAGIQNVTNRIGFKTFYCDVNKGFFLNGCHMKLNGVCEHHDLGLLGAEFDKTAMRRKIEILKGMGVNAIRGTHNMMAPGLLDLCDEMGILFVSEAFDMWNHPKTEYDYARFFDEWHEKDVASWVRRDRNHTCVIMWSIGNEIADIHNFEAEGQAMTRELMEMAASHDYLGNAYITQGSNFMPWPNAQKCADILKVAGYNYGEACYDEHHASHPDWIIYGSETSSITQSRGVYHLPLSANSLGEEDEQCSALGNSTTSWSAKSYELCAAIDRDAEYSQGQFLWSGFDYIGEPTPYKTRSCYFGQVDTAGFPKDSYYFWKSVWTDPETDPFVHIFPYWDFNEGQIVDVRVVSNLPEVELWLNGRSLGRQTLDHEPGSGHHLIADYSIPYEKGDLTAAAYEACGSSEIKARASRHSFGDTDHLICKEYEFTSTDEPQALHFYEVSAVDKDGYPVENACDRVHVQVSGKGRLVGMDNGDSADPDGYRVDTRRLFSGKLLICVDAPGIKDDEISVCCDGEAPAAGSVNIVITRDTDDYDVRRITLKCDESRELNPDYKSVYVKAYIEPAEASKHGITYRIVDDMGITSHLAAAEVEQSPDKPFEPVRITAKGDGHFRMRATAGSYGQKVRIISDLEFDASGLGLAYRNPYEFVAGSTYSSSIGEVGSGNEKGFATARSKRTVVIFDDLDFGASGADSVTIPIFAIESDDVPLKVWEGIPGQEGAKLLLDTVYSKPRQWSVFIEDTWKLAHRVSGIHSISFEFDSKVHVKGFTFGRADKARMRLSAAEADAIYGDDFVRTDDAVEKIGNNVSIEFKHMDFGETGIDKIMLCGRTRKDSNPVHVRFFRGEEAVKEVCEFPKAEEYTEMSFPMPHMTGEWDVSFIFLPGSDFDFSSFRFE